AEARDRGRTATPAWAPRRWDRARARCARRSSPPAAGLVARGRGRPRADPASSPAASTRDRHRAPPARTSRSGRRCRPAAPAARQPGPSPRPVVRHGGRSPQSGGVRRASGEGSAMLRRVRRPLVVLLFLAIFAGEIMWHAIVPLIPEFSHRFGLSKFEGGEL